MCINRFLSLFFAFTLTACAQAAVAPPSVDRAGIEREQATQRQYAEAAAAGDKTYTVAQADVNRLQGVAQKVREAGAEVCNHLGTNQTNCSYGIKLVTEPEDKAMVPNAYADGNTIFITLAMLAITDSTEELAFILSHEYAHNVLTHVDKKTRNAMLGMLAGTLADRLLATRGLETGGQFGEVGAQLGANRYSVAYEREADYVGLYILERAGYDVRKAEEVWRRMAATNPQSIYIQSTHPTSAERYLSMQAIIEEIQAKKKAGQPVLPNRAPED